MTDKRKIVKREFHSFHVTEETDHGILESGIYQGQRFVTSVTGCGTSLEAAERALERGGSFTGYRTEAP